MMSTEDTVRLSALLFESRQVCAEVVSASRGLNDRQLYEAAIGMSAKASRTAMSSQGASI